MSSDSDTRSLFMSVSEEKGEEEKGGGQGERSGEEKLGERGMVSKTTQRGEDPWEGGGREAGAVFQVS